MHTQADADQLLKLAKDYTGPPTLTLPPGEARIYELRSPEPGQAERFVLHLRRERQMMITLSASAFRHVEHLRVRGDLCIARLCVNGRPHTNPDEAGGQTMPRTHLHVFREGLGDSVAVVPDPLVFSDLRDPAQTIQDFFVYCNISPSPNITLGLF